MIQETIARLSGKLVFDVDSRGLQQFQAMMQKRSPSTASSGSLKRKSQDTLSTPAPKSSKSSRSSTPATSIRGRKRKGRKSYTEADASGEDDLSDDEFEQKLAEELDGSDKVEDISDESPEEIERARILELASKLSHPLHKLVLTQPQEKKFLIRSSATLSCSSDSPATLPSTSTTPGQHPREFQLMRPL